MKKREITAIMKLFIAFLVLTVYTSPSMAGEGKGTILFHIKTGLKHDDSQICVAYNMIWAALEEGLNVDVLIDADAINTFKVGWRGKDDIEDFALPERLRKSLAAQFNVPLQEVPENYGRFLNLLHNKGANFYINTAFLALAKIEKEMGTVENISAKFFKPVTLKEMVRLRTKADRYMVY